MNNKEQFEREFESFLNEEDSRLGALYRKLPRAEPDAKVDAAVLAMARRAVATTPRTNARAPRWIPALSAAAIVALAGGIAFRLGPTVWRQYDTQSQQRPASENAVAPAPAASVQKAQRQAIEALKDKAAAESAPVDIHERAAAPAPAAPPAATAVAGYAAPAKPEVRAQVRKAEPAAKRIDTPVPQPFPTQSAAVEQEKKAVGTAGASSAIQGAVRGDLDAHGLDRKRDNSQAPPAVGVPALRVREDSAPVPMSEPVDAPSPPSAREQPTTPPPPIAGDATDESALAAPAAAAKAARMSPLRSKDPNARLYPEHWLANIRVMLREDQRDAALRSLAEFRRIYPEYHLPDDLSDLK